MATEVPALDRDERIVGFAAGSSYEVVELIGAWLEALSLTFAHLFHSSGEGAYGIVWYGRLRAQ